MGRGIDVVRRVKERCRLRLALRMAASAALVGERDAVSSLRFLASAREGPLARRPEIQLLTIRAPRRRRRRSTAQNE